MSEPETPETPEPPRLVWRCPVCRQRLALRPKSEDEAKFRERCHAHQRSRRVCEARLLIKKLRAEGLVPLRSIAENDYTCEYLGLNDAGLVTWHLTHVIGDNYVRRSPWGPSWAARYDQYLRVKREMALQRRARELREAAESPESIDRAKVFLAFAYRDVDLGGKP